MSWAEDKLPKNVLGESDEGKEFWSETSESNEIGKDAFFLPLKWEPFRLPEEGVLKYLAMREGDIGKKYERFQKII